MIRGRVPGVFWVNRVISWFCRAVCGRRATYVRRSSGLSDQVIGPSPPPVVCLDNQEGQESQIKKGTVSALNLRYQNNNYFSRQREICFRKIAYCDA